MKLTSIFTSNDRRGDGASEPLFGHRDRGIDYISPESLTAVNVAQARQVTRVALRLKAFIEAVIPCELEEDLITRSHSRVITPAVIQAAKDAAKGVTISGEGSERATEAMRSVAATAGQRRGQNDEDEEDAATNDGAGAGAAVDADVDADAGADREADAPTSSRRHHLVGTSHEHALQNDDLSGCVVYGLLVCYRFFWRQARSELWDADLHEARMVACDLLAKRIVESYDDDESEFMMEQVLLRRYSVIVRGQLSAPANVIERAVDLHTLRVIGSSGYQRTINQNALQLLFSIIYLGLFTAAINTVNPGGDLDIVEGFLYIFTLGFIADEVSKFVKIGRHYISFWNTFNSLLYTILAASFIIRMIALSYPQPDGGPYPKPPPDGSDEPAPLPDDPRTTYNALSYNLLAFSAPFFWMRLLLYLDTFKFFGTMLVVLKHMMKESAIFFALLIGVVAGFLQAFIGLDQVDDNLTATQFIIKAMAGSVLQSPDFDGFDNFAPPFGLILYMIFTFIITVILLNILIALFGESYSSVTENSTDEYMALFAQKTIQFTRAPDENVFVAPMNLIELFLLVLPFEWWMPKQRYEQLNDIVMGIIYSPLLLLTAYLERSEARRVIANRRKGEEDEDRLEEWEAMAEELGEEVSLGDEEEGEEEENETATSAAAADTAQGDHAAAGSGSGSSSEPLARSTTTTTTSKKEKWQRQARKAIPNIELDQATVEVKALRKEVDALRALVLKQPQPQQPQ
ncbi:Calcium channel yvc1 [Tilletia horrida]|nr:Calcium channel yvc1 [Tilletia horrida]